MVKVLVVHNKYSSTIPSGENASVDDQIALLSSAGYEVETFTRSNDDLAQARALGKWAKAVRPVYGGEAVRSFVSQLESFRPDLVHMENVFPLISPWVIREASKRCVPVVAGVRSYRRVCMAASFFREGRGCFDCQPQSIPWAGVRHGCYAGSHLASLSMAASATVHRRTWFCIDHYLPISQFMAEWLRGTGISPESITVKPNFLSDPGVSGPPVGGVLYAGRLSAEKGVELLLNAWRASAVASTLPLTVAGDGPLRHMVIEAAAAGSGAIRYVGQLDRSALADEFRRCAVVVVPSLWHEPFGRTVIEAYAYGRPVIATRMGGLSELVDSSTGWLVAPSVSGLAGALRDAADERMRLQRASAARQRFLESYTPKAHIAIINAVYERVLCASRPPM